MYVFSLPHFVSYACRYANTDPASTHSWVPTGPQVGKPCGPHLGFIWVCTRDPNGSHLGFTWAPTWAPNGLYGPHLGSTWAPLGIHLGSTLHSFYIDTLFVLSLRIFTNCFLVPIKKCHNSVAKRALL